MHKNQCLSCGLEVSPDTAEQFYPQFCDEDCANAYLDARPDREHDALVEDQIIGNY